jgi:transposase
MRKDKILISKEELYNLYIKQNLQMEEVAKRLNVSKGTIMRRVKEFNLYKPRELVIEKSKRYKNISKEALEKLYYDENMTILDIAKFFQVSLNTVANKLKRLNIKRRSPIFTLDDLIGKTFDKLTVIGLSDKSTKNGTRLWECKCECGTIKEIPTHKIKSGEVKSCGKCGRKKRDPNDYPYGEITIGFWNNIKRNALCRNLEFDITIEFIWELFLKQDRKCALTDIEIRMPSIIYSDRVATYDAASLDRIDSSKGYIKENVQWVHKYINYMKQDLSEEEFIFFCKKVAEKNNESIIFGKLG